MTIKHKTLYLIAFLLLAASVYVQFLAGMAGDKNWLLIAARMWISGKQLYVDIFEVNPPLIIWIYALPSWVGLHLGLEDYYVLVFLGLCVIAFSIFISTRIIQFHPVFSDDLQKRYLFAALLVFVFIFDTSPAYFFDREHIFLVLTFPYILRWMPGVLRALSYQKLVFPASAASSSVTGGRHSERSDLSAEALAKGEESRETLPLRFAQGQGDGFVLPICLHILIGIMAGVGFCIKPHCLIVFAGIQLIYMLRERSLRILISTENCLIYGIGLTYLFSIWWCTPEYFSVVLPMALEAYSGYSNKKGGMWFSAIAFVMMAAIFVDFRLRHASPYRKDIFYLLAVCVPFLLYAFANNGWGYTYNPLFSILLVLAAFVLWECLALKKECAVQGLPVKRLVFCVRNCMIVFFVNIGLALLNGYLVLTADCEQYYSCKMENRMREMMQDNHAHSFGTLAVEFHTWPDLLRASDVTLKTRFNHLWMLPKFITSGPHFAVKHQWILEYVASSYAYDMEHNKPDIMFVDNSPEFYRTGKQVDLIAYFNFSADFRTQWQHYHYLQTVDGCPGAAAMATQPLNSAAVSGGAECRYDVYKRGP